MNYVRLGGDCWERNRFGHHGFQTWRDNTATGCDNWTSGSDKATQDNYARLGGSCPAGRLGGICAVAHDTVSSYKLWHAGSVVLSAPATGNFSCLFH